MRKKYKGSLSLGRKIGMAQEVMIKIITMVTNNNNNNPPLAVIYPSYTLYTLTHLFNLVNLLHKNVKKCLYTINNS